MLYELYRIEQILKNSDFDFSMKSLYTDSEDVSYLPLNCILEDYVDMFHMLCDISELINTIIHEEDENINIGKLMADQDQEGEHNEL